MPECPNAECPNAECRMPNARCICIEVNVTRAVREGALNLTLGLLATRVKQPQQLRALRLSSLQALKLLVFSGELLSRFT